MQPAREPLFAGLGQASPTASPSARDADPIFEGPFHELVAIGLSRTALEALVASSLRPQTPTDTTSPIDRAYLLKILDEEIGRQFAHPLRPIVELVLNGVDATRPGAMRAERAVDVMLSDRGVVVEDRGEGMTLRVILSRLLVPFATDKSPGIDLGRFGVGFFSVLAFGLADPDGFSVRVETGTGTEGWSMRVVSQGREVETLLCAIRRIEAVRGTRVTVTSGLLDPDTVRGYLQGALHFFPHERAELRIDGAPVNDGSLIAGGRLLEDVAAAGPPPVIARYHLGGRGLWPGIMSATYHTGVKVESCLAIAELALIDFPGAVELTEGRDALKPGPAFTAVATAFYRRLARIGAAADDVMRRRLAEMAGQVSALMLQSAGWNEAAPELARMLLGPEKYLVGAERVEAILGFLGPDVAERLFVPESFWAERHWIGHIPGERELLERELEIDPVQPLDDLVRHRRDLPGLAIVAARAPDATAIPVMLARPRIGRLRSVGRGTAVMPCLGTRRGMLIREDARALASPEGWAELYALRAAFDRASGQREAEVERNIIVRDPMALGGP